MAIRRIFKNEDSVLYRVCRPVEKFDRRLAELLQDMADTLYNADGVGLAAAQIGILRRVVVIDCGDGLIELVNPEVIETAGEQLGYEGCLSFPGEQGFVIRPNYVHLRAQDRDGNLHEYKGEELLARAMMHECDHLDGLIYKRLITEPPAGWTPPQDSEDEGDTGEKK